MKHPYLIGSGLLLITMPIHFFVSEPVSVMIAAVLLGAIGGAYVGFAAADGRVSAFVFEIVGATVFGTAAVVGLIWYQLAIPIGILAHAGWDFINHNDFTGARIPQW